MPFRIDSIVAASDLSPSSNEVIRSAAALAALTGAALHVVHAEDAGGGAGVSLRSRPSPEVVDALRRQVAESVPPSATVTSEHVAVGPAPTAILMRAAEVEAELIVVGAHRERPGGDGALGTTADQVVRASPRPCLVVRGPVSLPLRQILVPTDLSRAAEIALDVALTWGIALRMPRTSGRTTGMDVLHVAADEPREAPVEEQVATALRHAGTSTGLDVRARAVRADDPVQAILHFADETGADLIVMATHGKHGEQAAPGSVSSAVTRRSPAPVLLVPPVVWRTRQAREAAMQATAAEARRPV